jgi:hypothetical protein
MAAKITRKAAVAELADKKPAVKALDKITATKPARKPREAKPEAKRRLSKGRPVAETPKAKPVKPLQFRDLWSENVLTIKEYVNRFGGHDAARVYIDYAEDELPSNILRINKGMLCSMIAGSDQDVERAYRRALISYNLGQLAPHQVANVQRLYSSQTIAKWRKEISHPSYETLTELESYGIYLVAGSILEEDAPQQPPQKQPGAPLYPAGDEIYEIFKLRDLERCAYAAVDYERNVNTNMAFDDYERLSKIAAFRAMMELWPLSFRHYANVGADIRDVTWTLITDEFKAVVSHERVEVIIGTDVAGYTLYASVDSLEEALEGVFHHFDTLSTDQLQGMLRTVGFDQMYVAGMKFDLLANRSFNPGAFVKPTYEHAVEIYHNSARMSAADFLLLAAQTTRGVFIERAETHGTFDEYNLIVDDMLFRVMYLDKTDASSNVHHCVASLSLHQNILMTGRLSLEAHGVYIAENSVMQLPVSEAAQERFFPDVENTEDEILFINSVTFV